MDAYRFYYLNDANRIVDAEWASCPNDEAAIHRATRLLGDSRNCCAVEVWQGVRLVRTPVTAL
jgi:hypothetical protein